MKRCFVLLSAAVLCPWGVVSGQSEALDQEFAPQLASPSGAPVAVHADGSVDDTFVPPETSTTYYYQVAHQSDGRILVAGDLISDYPLARHELGHATSAPVREGHEPVVTNTVGSSNQFFRLVSRPPEP